jgi:mannose-6-phosphate isomerase-like protein (cupin superfamily)
MEPKGVAQSLSCKAAHRPEAGMRSRCYRPWDHYERRFQRERCQVNGSCSTPGGGYRCRAISIVFDHWGGHERHRHRVTRDAETLIVGEDESVYLPLGCVHRLENQGRFR